MDINNWIAVGIATITLIVTIGIAFMKWYSFSVAGQMWKNKKILKRSARTTEERREEKRKMDNL